VVYTVYLGFTNYGSFNLLTFERAQGVLLQGRIIDRDLERPFSIVRDGAAYRVFLPEGDAGLLSEPLPLDGAEITVPVAPVTTAPTDILAMRDVVPMRDALGQVSLTLPDGTVLRQAGLRTFAGVEPAWRVEEGGRLVSTSDG